MRSRSILLLNRVVHESYDLTSRLRSKWWDEWHQNDDVELFASSTLRSDRHVCAACVLRCFVTIGCYTAAEDVAMRGAQSSK